MSITRLSGGLTPADGSDPRTFPEIFNDAADQIEAQASATCFKCRIASGVNVNTTNNPSALFDTSAQLINFGSFTFTNSAITVPTGGVYMVAWNVFFSGTVVRANPLLGLVVNGSSDDTIVSGHSYMRSASGHDESSSNASGLINLSAGNTIGIRTSPLAETGAVTTDAGLGSISIYRIGNNS